jgi:OPA family glycerol-3-phosphate transporter-like MFS transporter
VIITLGIYFAFDWGAAIVSASRKAVVENELGWFALFVRKVFGVGDGVVNENWWLFFIPAIFMAATWVAMFVWLRNTPGEAGFSNFDTGEESISHDGERASPWQVFAKILTHPVLLPVCIIESFSGVLRNGVMHWYSIFAREVEGYKDLVVTKHWGLALLICGVIGSWLTGWISDKYFYSRRAPMVCLLYLLMFVGTIVMCLSLENDPWFVALSVLVISTAVIGVHGILSGTATADFAGKNNTGATVGIVDGCVYLGTAFQSFVLGNITPSGEEAKVADNWWAWPLFLTPFALAGFLMALKIIHALPSKVKSQIASEIAAERTLGEKSADLTHLQ